MYSSYMYSLIYFSDDELRQARKLRFILLNMDFKWLALLSFVVFTSSMTLTGLYAVGFMHSQMTSRSL